MKELKFSIIMPCYNSEKYIARAIDSLLNQSYLNWELIAVNDGSTDKTKEIIEKYAIDDNRITCHNKANGGYSSAVNFGMKFIRGDYFMFMGSDDALASNLLGELVNSMSNYSPDIIGFRAIRIHKDSSQLDSITNFDSIACLNNACIKTFESQFPIHSKILGIRDTAKCFKYSLKGKLEYFGKYGYDADGIFSTLFCHKCHSFLVVPVDGYLWTIRGDSLSSKTTKSINFDRISNWVSFIKELSQVDISQLTNRDAYYVTFPITISDEILKNEKKLSLKEIRTIVKSRKIALNFCKKIGIDVQLNKRRWKNFIIKKCQLFYCIYHRYKIKNLN